MATVVIYCKKCGIGYASLGEIPATCPACDQETSWTTVPPSSDTPTVAYKLTVNDRRFLRSYRIAAED